MGKDTRRKTKTDVLVLDVSAAAIGVRTRARTLDTQRRQSSPAAALQTKSDYLELRSRSLLKLPFKQYLQKWGRKAATETEKENCQLLSPEGKQGRGLVSRTETCIQGRSGGFEIGNSETEGSLGENRVAAENRTTRESTPSSNSIRTVDAAVTAPGSSTKRKSRAANLGVQNTFLRNIPTFREMDEFFVNAEQQERHDFIEKYNFDIVNDLPLPGRFEWVCLEQM